MTAASSAAFPSSDLSPAASCENKSHAAFWISVLALIALVAKLTIAFNTFGSNDVVAFYTFARSLADHGLEWTYRNGVVFVPSSPLFNHPPLTAYYLTLINGLAHHEVFRSYGLTFPFLLRLPGIVADFIVVLVLLRLSSTITKFRIPNWALALFALSPVSVMVSGFHGNTDSVMVMFLVLAAFLAAKDKPFLCGLFLALSAQVKIIPLLFFSVFSFFWFSRRKIWAFVIPFVVSSCLLSAEPLLKFPATFLKNILSYGSFWGLWGITYFLRLTGYESLSRVTFFHLPPWEFVIVALLKILIIAGVFVVSWRRRKLNGLDLFHSIAYVWIIFFVFSPGIGVQYMVWLAPFILILSPTLYGFLVAGSSLFLFFFYNVTAGGLPWYLAISTNKLNVLWAPWSLWPWATLAIALFIFQRKMRDFRPVMIPPAS